MKAASGASPLGFRREVTQIKRNNNRTESLKFPTIARKLSFFKRFEVQVWGSVELKACSPLVDCAVSRERRRVIAGQTNRLVLKGLS